MRLIAFGLYCPAVGRFPTSFPLFVMANANKTPSPAQSSETSQEVNEATAPKFRDRYGNVAISSWLKTVNAGTDKERQTHGTTVTREYRDGDQPKRTPVLFDDDLLQAGLGLILRWVKIEQEKASRRASNAK